MHGPAVFRMGMAEHHGEPRRRMLRLFQQRLKTTGGTGDPMRFDAPGHSFSTQPLPYGRGSVKECVTEPRA